MGEFIGGMIFRSSCWVVAVGTHIDKSLGRIATRGSSVDTRIFGILSHKKRWVQYNSPMDIP